MLKTLFMATILATASTTSADLPAITNYLGTIDGKLPVSLALDSRDHDRLTGSYVYSQYGEPIDLTGKRTLDPQSRNNFSLQEAKPDTGTLELTQALNGTLTGTWKNADGKRTLPVSLTPAAETISLVAAQSNRYEIRTAYVQLTAQTPFAKSLNAHLEKAALNAHNKNVKSYAADTAKDAANGGGFFPYSREETPFLLYASDSLVSIRSLATYYTGGAHGNSSYSSQNFAWIQGKLVEITPAKIIPQAQWPALRDLCIKELKVLGASSAQDIEFKKDTPPKITFTSRALLLAFDPYEAGCYAEGDFIVSLPYARVKSLVAPDSPLAPLLPK
jgi:hypothetical protein